MFYPAPKLQHPVGVEVYFGPEDNIPEKIIAAIDGARKEVLVNHYLITDPAVLNALARAFSRKCVVIVALDSMPAVERYTGFKELQARSIPSVPVKVKGGWNNNKYIVVDRSLVLIGSGDLTRVSGRNRETLMTFREPSIVAAFYNHFISHILGLSL